MWDTIFKRLWSLDTIARPLNFTFYTTYIFVLNVYYFCLKLVKIYIAKMLHLVAIKSGKYSMKSCFFAHKCVTVWTTLTNTWLCIALQATLLFLLHVGAAAWACVKCFRLEANKKTLFSSILYQCGIQRLGRDPKHGHRNIKKVHALQQSRSMTNAWRLQFRAGGGRWLQLGPPVQNYIHPWKCEEVQIIVSTKWHMCCYS